MKKQLLLLCCGISSAIALNAQNLVPNPGFEVQDSCPAVSEIELAQPWISASMGTPDLFNSTCPTQNLTPRTGIGSSGVYVRNTFANNREYLEAPLNSALIAGQTYCVSFYVKRANYRYSCNRIGAYFASDLVDQSTTGLLAFTPQVDHNPATALSTGTSWSNISGSFVASGGEDHILIGSFASDAETDTLVANAGSTSKVCFYYIDDISVTVCNTAGIDEADAGSGITLFPNPAANSVSIGLDEFTSVQSVVICDAVGKEIARMDNPEQAGGVITFNGLNAPDGTYIVRVSSNNGIFNKRLIIRN